MSKTRQEERFHVAYVTMLFPADSETFVTNQVKALMDLGTRVSVCALVPPPSNWRTLLSERGVEGASILPISGKRLAFPLKAAVRNPRSVLRLLLFVLRALWKRPDHLVKSLLLIPRCVEILVHLKRERPDVIHLFWGHYPSLVGYLVHREMPETRLTMWLGAHDMRICYGGTRRLAMIADIVFTQALVNVPDIRRLGVNAERIEVIYDGLFIGRFADAREFAEKVARRIVTVGRLIPLKGMDSVIRVFKQTAAEFSDSTLHILGDGTERTYLEQLAEDADLTRRVIFRGHVSNEEVFAELRNAEIFLFLSHIERLPNVVKEAIACRCICIASHTPGIEELIPDCNHGFVVEHDDIDGAAALIRRVFNADVPADAMKHRAYEFLKGRVDVVENMKRYLHVWSEL